MTGQLRTVEIRHFHLFGAIGGGAKGFQNGKARVDTLEAKFRCIGSVDSDAAACRDFELRIGVRATVLDLFTRAQYRAWHGAEPPADWREATPQDIQLAAGGERPHIVFTSPPCKGFSGLLNEAKSRTAKYQALAELTLRGVWLTCEAWADDPPEFILLENVPRIATRGRHLLDQIKALLSRYGYAISETTHDCGELGGLAQSRKRFLLVARHMGKVPPFLYEPRRRPLQAVGTVLGRCPLPGDPRAGVMHRMPSLHWKTWVRLAFVEAGRDWRSLNRLAIEDGYLADYAIAPEADYHGGYLGVRAWDMPTGTFTGQSMPTNGAHAVADPRFDSGGNDFAQYGVRQWDRPTGAVINVKSPGQGAYAVADPRMLGGTEAGRHSNIYRVVHWDDVGRCVTGGHGPSNGGMSIADPRCPWSPAAHRSKYRVADWESSSGTITGAQQVASGALAIADPRCSTAYGGAGKYAVTPYDALTGTVISGSTTGHGAFAVADPRPGMVREQGDAYLTGGHYGVVPYDATSGAVTSSGRHDNGFNSVADPRLPASSDKLVAVIRALDGTWHRPFTTFELAALQSLVDPEEQLELDGMSDSAWRERIGNAVPPAAAEAIACVMGRTLLMAWSGQTFFLDAEPIWVRPVAVAIALPSATGGA